LHVALRNKVDRDVDASGTGGDRVSMCVDRGLVERVEYRGVGDTSGEPDLVGHALQAGSRAAGEMDVRSLPCEGASDRAADRTAAPVDDGVLVVQQHGHAVRRYVSRRS
jgi:hypothetical protein